MTDSVQQLSKAQERKEKKNTHPSSPQLKQAPEGLRGSGHSRAKWPSPPQLEFRQPFIFQQETEGHEGRNLLATVAIIRRRTTITVTISRLETVRVEVVHGLETAIAFVSLVTNMKRHLTRLVVFVMRVRTGVPVTRSSTSIPRHREEDLDGT